MKADIIWDDDSETTMVILLEPIEVGGWTVPAGVTSDGGSIPRFAWPWCSPLDGRYIHIFLLHDWLFETHFITRAQADRTLLDLLILAGMRRTQAYAIYCAVRVFGGSHWSNART